MVARKSRRRFRKPIRRTRRHSTAGKILPPLDVRNRGHLKEFERRIKKGPVTIVLVYADWCGHCHTMMPHFDAASKSPSRSIQSVKLNESMLDSANDFMKKNINSNAKPISVDGYPSIILVNNKGDKISDVESVRDTSAMTKVMSKAGPLAEKAGISQNIGEEPAGMISEEPMQPSRNSMRATSMQASRNSKQLSIGKAPSASTELDEPQPLSKSKSLNVTGNIDKETELMLETAPISESRNTTASLVSPEEENTDLVQEGQTNVGKVGGSLLNALARTTYKLAPTAALLATAAFVMKSRRTRRTRKGRKEKKSRSTRRRR